MPPIPPKPKKRAPLRECANPECPRRARHYARTWYCSNACRQAVGGIVGTIREGQQRTKEYLDAVRARDHEGA